MIDIAVDEAYAFDMLSILAVKYDKTENEGNLKKFNLFESEIEQKVGKGLFYDVVVSMEYSNLYHANLKLFELIDQIKTDDSIKAKKIDDLNYARWEAKRDLQKKFFNQEIKEVKIGYEQP